MSEGEQIRYTPWVDYSGDHSYCRKCRTKGVFVHGMMKRRRVTGRDGESHLEYKIVCPDCEVNSGAYRSPRLAVIAWNAKQVPEDDGLKHRSRKPAGGGTV